MSRITIDDAIALIEPLLKRGHLTPLQTIVFREAWTGKTYTEIAQHSGYDPGHVKDVGAELWQMLSQALGEKVTKKTLHGVMQRVKARTLTAAPATFIPPAAGVDWGEAIDVAIFYGREHELAQLRQWVEGDRCRLVTLLGMGGMGKTSLSVKFAETVQPEFERVIWRSLRNAPPLDELLGVLIQFLSQQKAKDIPDTLSGKLTLLIELFRRSRCLVVLDNFDAVLQSGRWAGTYRTGYEGYGELLRCVGDMAHQSCLVLTSREKPQEVATQEGAILPVRTLPLAGVDLAAGCQILHAKGLQGALPLEQVILHYRGNPLALKMAATSIQDLFAANIPQFLNQGSVAFSGIGQLLHQQCDRLTPAEQSLMDWLAINREPVPLSDLQADSVTDLPTSTVMQILESLRWRSLIESSAAGFTQQPVVMEYITESLIERVATEIITEQPQVFLSHALIKAQVKDYLRDSQARVIVQSLVDRLLMELGSPKQLENKLNRLLAVLRTHYAHQPNYGAGNLINLFRQLETDLTGYDFSHLSIRQAYLSDVNLHRVNFTGVEFVNCTFASTFGGVTCVTFSPSGEQLATSDTNGSIQIWSLPDGKQLALCNGHNSWVWSMDYSPSHPILASGGQDHQVRLWDSTTGHCLKVLDGHAGIVTSVAFSPDGQLLASTSGDHTIRLWHVATGRCVQVLQGHAACIWSSVFHPDGKTLFSGGEDKVIRQWDVNKGQCVQTLVGHEHWVRAIALSPDGQSLASGSHDHTVKVWDLTTSHCVTTLTGHHKPVTALAFSPDGSLLTSSSYDQTVKLWDVASQRCVQTLQKHTNIVWSVACHPTQALIASGGEDYTTRLWDIATGQCTKTIQGHSNSMYAIALSAHHHLLASGHEDQTVKLWDLNPHGLLSNTAAPLPFRTLRGHTGKVLSVAMSTDDRVLASAGTDGTVRLWNPHTGQCLKILHGHISWIWAIAIHPNSNLLASASYDHTVRLWDMTTGDCLHTLKDHTNAVLSVAFSPDGNWLASGGYEQTIKLWNPKTGQCLRTLNAHLNRVWAIAFSPDSAWLATGGDDGTVKLWNVATGECRRTLTGHRNQVLSLLFNATGDRLLSSSADTTIRTWIVDTGDCTTTFQQHQHWVWSLAHINPNVLLSCSQDETINVWDIPTGDPIKTLRCPRPYEGTIITQATGLTDAQTVTLQALGAVG